MPLDVVRDERAQRNHVEALAGRVVQRRGREPASEATPFQRLHQRIHDQHRAVDAATAHRDIEALLGFRPDKAKRIQGRALNAFLGPLHKRMRSLKM